MLKRFDRIAKTVLLGAVVLILGTAEGRSQAAPQTMTSPIAQEPKSPGGAFLRSLVVPGWGHHYADKHDWNRGRVHLGADVVLLAAVLGYNGQYRNTREAMFTVARSHAGVNVEGRDKSFQLAVAQFNSLQDYNEYQEQTRNWDRFIDVVPGNQWQWADEATRIRYDNLRGKSENTKRQIPMLIGLMAANRVISGISSAVRVRNYNRELPDVALAPVMDDGLRGLTAQVNFRF